VNDCFDKSDIGPTVTMLAWNKGNCLYQGDIRLSNGHCASFLIVKLFSLTGCYNQLPNF